MLCKKHFCNIINHRYIYEHFLFILNLLPKIDMPASKAELQVEIREMLKGTPWKMSVSQMTLHELETAKATLAKMKSEHATQVATIPVVGPGRPKSRPIEAPAAEEDEDAIRIPQPPKPRLTKAPLVNNISPDRPTGRPPKVKKEVKIEEEAVPLKGKSAPSHICNCPHCPTRK